MTTRVLIVTDELIDKLQNHLGVFDSPSVIDEFGPHWDTISPEGEALQNAVDGVHALISMLSDEDVIVEFVDPAVI